TSVDHLNITVNQGEIYGFLGRNGAGKTTTIRMLLGLIKPTFGQVEIFGENLFNNQKSILRRIGSIVEVPGFYENLTRSEERRVGKECRARGGTERDVRKEDVSDRGMRE